MSTAMVPASGSELERVDTMAHELDRPLNTKQLQARLALIQQVMRDVMLDGYDYGKIPGTDKPSLFKPGAEKLCVTFRLAAGDPQIEDLGDGYEHRYRVRVPILAANGIVLAVGVGECSTSEEKYSWRRPTHQKEYDRTPDDRRRIKFQRSGEEWHQVRTNPADVANTVLKMAHKRGYVHGVVMATGASALFNQDLEDLPEELRESVTSDRANDASSSGSGRSTLQPPQRKAAAPSTSSSGGPAACTASPGTPLLVTKVTSKSGESNGRAWTVYGVHFSDGLLASTFDTKIADLAQQCATGHVPVARTTEPGKREGSHNLTELVMVEREPGSDDE